MATVRAGGASRRGWRAVVAGAVAATCGGLVLSAAQPAVAAGSDSSTRIVQLGYGIDRGDDSLIRWGSFDSASGKLSGASTGTTEEHWWNLARGAFITDDGTLYTIDSKGLMHAWFYSYGYFGRTWSQVGDLPSDAVKASAAVVSMQGTTSAFYDAKKMYWVRGDQLRVRGFEPAQWPDFVAKVDWNGYQVVDQAAVSQLRGGKGVRGVVSTFLVDGYLYLVDINGVLSKVAWSNGQLDASTWQEVDRNPAVWTYLTVADNGPDLAE